MNAHFTVARRQVASLQSDLLSLEAAYATSTNTSSLNGQIIASLSALNRTTEDYENMAKREIVETVKEKALSRVAKFKDDYNSLRKQHERIKQSGVNIKASLDRENLLSSSSSAIASSSSPYSTSQSSGPSSRGPRMNSTSAPTPESPFTINMSSNYTLNNPNGVSQNSYGNGSNGDTRTDYALKENSFLTNTSNTLDMYIAQGQAVLGNLGNQRETLKGTRTRLLSAANTMGLSRDTIQFIERRTAGDFYILCGGAFTVLVSFYLILKYFG